MQQDAIAQLELLWPAVQRELDKATKEQQDWVSDRQRSMSMFIDGADIEDIEDPRRLGFAHPPTVRLLLEKGTLAEQARYYPLTADLLCLNRSMSSKIPMDFDTEDVYDCKQNMKPVFMQTLTTEFLDEEKCEQQIQHREASLRFLDACRGPAKSQAKGKKEKPVYPVAEMRELLLTAASTKLRLFNDVCKSIGKDTLVDSLAEYRENGFDGWAFVRFICTHTSAPLPSTAFGYLQFMCEGSPMIRALLKIVCKDNMFLSPRKHGKLFILDDTPLVAMFTHWVLNMFGVNTTLFHSGLSNDERNKLQDDFNRLGSDTACMSGLFKVGGLGRNFHPDCANGVLTSGGENHAAEVQGGGRLIRVRLQDLVFKDRSELTELL